MKINNEYEQGSLDWFNLRCGVVTASEADRIITPGKLKAVEGKGFQSYLAEKLAERWGGPLPGANTWDMDQGRILESEARRGFALETGVAVQAVGFISTDDGRAGCSPDGVIMGDDGDIVGGVEVKCPLPQTHLRYLLDGELPPEYRLQVHFSMLVTGAPFWWFFSYRRRMPPLCIKVGRDDDIAQKMQSALRVFTSEMDAAWETLVKMNGGEPRDWRTPPPAPMAQPELESDYARATGDMTP